MQDFFETLSKAANQLETHLEKNLAELLVDFFHVLTMQPQRHESLKRALEGDPDSEIVKDLRQFQILLVRLIKYSEIENHQEQKIVFSGFPEEDRDYIQKVSANTVGRRFCVTSEKRIGLVPEKVQVGDSLAAFLGADVPFVLRRAGDRVEGFEAYTLVGDAYVDGVMRGEVIPDSPDGGKRIVLV